MLESKIAGLSGNNFMNSIPNRVFAFLFVFRYLRLIVHIISFWLFRSVPVPLRPTLFPRDCAVIIPSVEPHGDKFNECIRSVLGNNPHQIIVVTVGKDKLFRAKQVCELIDPNIQVCAIEEANKRRQICHALQFVHTRITLLCDDSVVWPCHFLPEVLAPFEDNAVAIVGTVKRVRRINQGFTMSDFWNFIGCLYLERHNFEIAATNNIDGGVFVVSGRTSAHRSKNLKGPAFMHRFSNEMFFFGKIGPLNVDDDNFITRWAVSHGWKIKIQYTESARIETTLGMDRKKFFSQCLRWARTTWRSNSASLFTHRTVWRTQPWGVYAIYLTSFVNFALFYDFALFWTLNRTSFAGSQAMRYLGLWIFCSKIVKLLPHFLRNPRDLIWLPGYICFGYYHSLIKLYALFTFYVVAWGSRGNDVK